MPLQVLDIGLDIRLKSNMTSITVSKACFPFLVAVCPISQAIRSLFPVEAHAERMMKIADLDGTSTWFSTYRKSLHRDRVPTFEKPDGFKPREGDSSFENFYMFYMTISL